jgi:diguanylate cyclase (GGDEF)-like protein
MMRTNSVTPEAADVHNATRHNATVAAERAALTAALQSVLEALPQPNSGRDNIRLLCHTLLRATPHLRCVWVGFSKGKEEAVEPYAAAGDCLPEASDWRLPTHCFEASGPYMQAAPTHHPRALELSSLYAPWRDNPRECTANSALALPMRSVNRGLQGMIVLYADRLDYFSQVGIDLFQSFCHVAETVWKQSNLMSLLSQKAQFDPLTGLMSRRQITQALEKAMVDSLRDGQPLSVMLCRIEDFKRFNDLYGWLASDAIVAEFAKELTTVMRPRDKGGRWAGVEFLFILPATTLQEARSLASMVREHFAVNPVSVKNWAVRLDLSVGVAEYNENITASEDLVTHAGFDLQSDTDELPTSLHFL